MKYLFSLMAILLVFSCENKEKSQASSTHEKPTIAVVNYPLYYFSKTIGGDHVNVYLPSIGGDPVYWKPEARQISNYQKADIILANGAGYAKWMEKVSLPSSKIVITSNGFRDQWIEVEEGVTHSHGPEGEHVHKGTATTTWLNFEFAVFQAEEVYKSLAKVLPAKDEEFLANFQQLKKELNNLHKDMQTISETLGERSIIASHPLYQYTQEAYGLDIISLHWEPNEMPGEEDWKEVKHLMEDHQAKVMIYEAEPLPQIRLKLEQMGIKVVVFELLGNRPENGDFVEEMKKSVAQLYKAVST